MSDLADLKSPYMTGHSRAVARIAAEAARRSGFSEVEVDRVRRAGLLHDLGRLGVPSTIWDKPAALSDTELERVRLHPYFTTRMFSRCAPLAGLAELGSEHAERLDGSGYPRGIAGGQLSPAARLLAAADVYQALREPRAYRPAHEPESAAGELTSEVKAGRLDGEAVQAVLGAAGHRVPRRREWPAGLTAREVEVLSLLVRGSSNKQIAKRLVVSPRTVGNHIAHIYMKIGCSTRAQASLFAMRHGLLDQQPPPGEDGANDS